MGLMGGAPALVNLRTSQQKVDARKLHASALGPCLVSLRSHPHTRARLSTGRLAVSVCICIHAITTTTTPTYQQQQEHKNPRTARTFTRSRVAAHSCAPSAHMQNTMYIVCTRHHHRCATVSGPPARPPSAPPAMRATTCFGKTMHRRLAQIIWRAGGRTGGRAARVDLGLLARAQSLGKGISDIWMVNLKRCMFQRH